MEDYPSLRAFGPEVARPLADATTLQVHLFDQLVPAVLATPGPQR